MKLANTENEIGSWLDNEDNFSSVERFFWPIRELFLYFWNTPIKFYVNDPICAHKKVFWSQSKSIFATNLFQTKETQIKNDFESELIQSGKNLDL